MAKNHIYVVETLRGNIVECRFRGSVAVVDIYGNELLTLGNSHCVITLRSTIKPFQLVPLIEHGGIESFKLTSEEIALMAGSHEGESTHLEIGKRLLERQNIQESMLRCSPTPLTHNCSGKHIAMVLLSRLLGVSAENYTNQKHPVQRLIRKTLQQILDDSLGIETLIDGCGVPTYYCSLKKLAKAYAVFAGSDASVVHFSAMNEILNAMMLHPYTVGGDYRLETDLMSMLPLVAKIGAQGLFCIGIPEKKIGIAIKIESGSSDASECLAVEVLNLLGVLSNSQLSSLAKYLYRPITTTYEEIVGKFRPIVAGKIGGKVL